MPGFLTHYIAGQAVLKALPQNERTHISQTERLFNLGTQGPDFFFYYFPGFLRKRSRGVASEMHQQNLGLFLASMGKRAKYEDGDNLSTIFSYTAGFLAHYCLDAFAHPYVYAKTYSENNSKIKNSADHRKLETAIDIAMLKLLCEQKPASLKQWQLISSENNVLNIAATAVSGGLKDIYNREIPPNITSRAMRHMVSLTKILQSKTGRRKRWLALAEKLTIKEPAFSSMIHVQELADGKDYLNITKKPWLAPWEGADVENNSFVELFDMAVKETIHLVLALSEYVFGNMSEQNLKKELGNRSLKTGMCSGLMKIGA